MVRLPRLILPGLPYHVTQRGNRRGQTFFEDGDYALYRDLLAEAADRADTEIWCYCLMPGKLRCHLTKYTKLVTLSSRSASAAGDEQRDEHATLACHGGFLHSGSIPAKQMR